MNLRLMLVPLLLVTTGCPIVLVVPDPSRASTRGAMTPLDLKPFAIGATSREEVLLALGEPEIESEDGSIFVYWWYSFYGFGILSANNDESFIGAGGIRLNLFLKFDAAGKILRHKFVAGLDGADSVEIAEAMARW